jgi:hypothetical protein
MDLLLDYSDDLSLSAKQVKHECTDKNRRRLTLGEKRVIIQKYVAFADAFVNSDCDNDVARTIFDFVKDFNKGGKYIVNISSIGKWIHADKRGEFLSWGGANKLTNKVCFIQNVIQKVDEFLKLRDVYHSEFNEVARSPTVFNEFGVVARKFTPAETFLDY